MQDYITKDDLLALGIKLDDESIDSLIEHLNQTVEERIGAEIAANLSEDNLKELIVLQETADDETLAKWLTDRVPAQEEIAQEAIDIVLGELASESTSL